MSGDDGTIKKRKRVVQPLTDEALEEFQKEQKRRGVVYLSRVPPFMMPGQLRSLLSKFGEVERVFLQPETEREKKKRVQG
eukprot:CAMPEP_0198360428 /NCGR_PEP_ID=MMETSP1450-20131203/138377_1 /TAXON_ID=753684 ORGANISM="Madagascaria erythrocladiodes, Strain CCMP3234" /NCGR_SAMPLE_ID=MMETSP1450 /ASSEMBLY_ACC=CAM_ASM_001115 /LENGTH=79 /DNA_ID=CAMNT_0044067435 /DNA_START=19 /DNA_END=255 /DNA_ORIENTATION=+